MNQSAAHQPKAPRKGAERQISELGKLLEAWADRQRFRPTQTEIGREVGVSKQLVSDWFSGKYKGSMKPIYMDRLVRMMVEPGRPQQEVFEEVLQAILRDEGTLPPGKRIRVL